MNIILLIIAILKIVPLVMDMIKEGKIKEATTDEVLKAFEEEFGRRLDERVARARSASDDVGVFPTDKELDPFDRANKRGENRSDGSSENL